MTIFTKDISPPLYGDPITVWTSCGEFVRGQAGGDAPKLGGEPPPAELFDHTAGFAYVEGAAVQGCGLKGCAMAAEIPNVLLAGWSAGGGLDHAADGFGIVYRGGIFHGFFPL
jgi:hypothetical protein